MDRSLRIRPFYYAFAFYYLGLFVQQVNVKYSDHLKKILFLVAIGVLVIDILKNQKIKIVTNAKTVLCGMIFFAVLVISIYTKDFFLLAILFFSFSVESLDIDRLFKTAFVILFIATITVIMMSATGVVKDIVKIRMTGYYSGSIRHTLGFNWPLVLPNIVVFLGAFYGTYRKKLNCLYYGIWQLIGIVVFEFCDSRNGLISLEILLITQLVCDKCNHNKFWKKKYRKFLVYLSRCIFPVVAILSFIFMEMYKHGYPLGYFLDEILAHRLRWALYNLNLYPATILNVDNFENFRKTAKYVMDNGYFYAVLRYGYIYLVALSILIYKASRYFEKKGEYFGLVTIIVISIMNFIDNSLFSHGFFPLLIVGLFALKKSIADKRKCIT